MLVTWGPLVAGARAQCPPVVCLSRHPVLSLHQSACPASSLHCLISLLPPSPCRDVCEARRGKRGRRHQVHGQCGRIPGQEEVKDAGQVGVRDTGGGGVAVLGYTDLCSIICITRKFDGQGCTFYTVNNLKRSGRPRCRLI